MNHGGIPDSRQLAFLLRRDAPAWVFTRPGLTASPQAWTARPGHGSWSLYASWHVCVALVPTSFHLWQRNAGCHRSDHTFQAQIQPNHLSGNRQRLDLFFYQERDEVATCTILRESSSHGCTSIRQGTRPTDIQRCIHFCQCEVCSIPLESCPYVGCRLRTMFLLEGGILCSPLKEVEKGTVQVAQGLLQGDAGNFSEECRFLMLLQVYQSRGQTRVVEAFALLVVRIEVVPLLRGTISKCLER